MTTLQLCHQCGSAVEEQAKFCRRCGATAGAVAVDSPAAAANSALETAGPERASKGERGPRIKCICCRRQVPRFQVFQPHGNGWWVRSAGVTCARCVNDRLQQGERIVDRGLDWVSPGTLILMGLALFVLAELVSIAATAHYFYVFGLGLVFMAYYGIRGLLIQFGPHGAFVPAGKMPPLDYQRAVEIVQARSLRTSLNGSHDPDVFAGKWEAEALQLVAATKEAAPAPDLALAGAHMA